MEISYRSKSDVHGIGIQINYQPEEVDTLSVLIKKLEDAGFTKRLSGIPDSFRQKVYKVYFHRIGSDSFQQFTDYEVIQFVNDSEPIIRLYDKKFKGLKTNNRSTKIIVIPYDND